jgi:hypothetical protein
MQWLLSFLFFLALGVVSSACTVEAAQKSTATISSDAGTKPRAHRPDLAAARATVPARDGGDRTGRDAQAGNTNDPDGAGSPIGLTRAQLRAHRGLPTEIRGNNWIYTPDQPGCREVILSEVMAFKHGVVTAYRVERKQTHQDCEIRE